MAENPTKPGVGNLKPSI